MRLTNKDRASLSPLTSIVYWGTSLNFSHLWSRGLFIATSLPFIVSAPSTNTNIYANGWTFIRRRD